MIFKFLGRIALGVGYACVPIFGWMALYSSFKRVKSDEIAMIQNVSGNVELIEEGIHFRPFPGDTFSRAYKKSQDFIDFGPLKRVIVRANQIAYKTLENGEVSLLTPGIHIIDLSKNEHFDPALHIKNAMDDFLDFGSIKVVRVREGYAGVKTNSEGKYVMLPPGMHNITAKETFDPQRGIQNINQDDYTLGNIRHIRIKDGFLGESYLDGKFQQLNPGQHALPANHVFVKAVPVDTDIVDLGAEKIVTVKEGQVAIINTVGGVQQLVPGKHIIKQSEGNYFNSIITTSPQSLNLPSLLVMCTDRIEMRAESLLTFKIKDPLKTVGLGIDKICLFLKQIADGTLRTILSRHSSEDIAPSIHADEEHDKNKRHEKLEKMYKECVDELDKTAQVWGLEVTSLKITEILPADEAYLATIRDLGSQQSSAESKRRIAGNEAEIAKIKAEAEGTKVIAAKKAQEAALVESETAARTLEIQANARAKEITIMAEAEAQGIKLKALAEAERITAISDSSANASPITKAVMYLQAQADIMKTLDHPVVVQPTLGDTTQLYKNGNAFTLFSTKPTDIAEVAILQNLGQSMLSQL